MSLRFAQLLLSAIALLLFCLLLAILPLSADKSRVPREAPPKATAAPAEISPPEPAAVVSSSVSLPALYKASTVNVPAVYKLRSLVPLPPPPSSPTYIDLGTLGGPHSEALDVNNRGQVVGWSAVSAEDQSSGEGHAFLWLKGKMRDLGTLGGKDSAAYYINERGQVAGDSECSAGEDRHAFFWADGRMTDLGTLGGVSSTAAGLNDLGQVTGTSSTAAGDTHCFVWATGVMTDLGTLGGSNCSAYDINNRGQIVGDSTGAAAPDGDFYTHAFLWEKGVMTDLTLEKEPCTYGAALAINERGHVIGYTTQGPPDSDCGESHSVLWADGTVTELSYGGQGFSWLDAINDHDQVVGYGNRHCDCPPEMPVYCCSSDALLWEDGILINLGVRQGGHWPNRQNLLNNRGQVVLERIGQLYLWQDGALIPFATPVGSASYASAISDTGAVAGVSITYVDGGRASLWQIAAAAD